MHEFEQSQVRWHIPLLLGALHLDPTKIPRVIDTLKNWFQTEKKSQIVKVNCLQGLVDITINHHLEQGWLVDFVGRAMQTGSASIKARGRKLLKRLNAAQ